MFWKREAARSTDRKSSRRAFRRLRFEKLEDRHLLTASPLVAALYDRIDAAGELHVLPLPAGTTTGAATAAVGALSPLSAIPVLNSLAGAAASLYLDFNGHFDAVWGSYSNITTPAFDQDGDATTFSSGELSTIQQIWQYVAEDYAPFKINVTTVLPASFANGVAQRVVIGGNGSWLGQSAGGVSYVNSFTNSLTNSSYVFTKNLGNGNAKYTGEASSHEAGHAFGLQHQSRYSGATKVAEYYAGAGDGRAPIMGNSYSTTRGLWWNGTTTSSTTIQDDMSVLARSQNGFGYRADDHGNTVATATALAVSGSQVSATGVITTTSDVDYFSFTTGAGTITVSVNPPANYGNLDARLELRNATGTVIASAAPTNSFGATITTTLAAGSYRIVVASQGNYGDVGTYAVSGTIVPTTTTVVATPTNLAAIVNTSSQAVLTWTDNANNEASYLVERQTGTGTFTQIATLSANVTSYTDTTVAAGLTYSYRVRAATGTVFSSYSNTASVTLSATVVSITATDNGAAETLGTAVANTGTFLVTRTGSSTSALTVTFTVGGTATSGVDYNSIVTSVVIAAGQTWASITVTPRDDTLVEGAETVIVTLASSTSYQIDSTRASATVSITDNDGITGPVNNNFANRINITGNNTVVAGTNVGATAETGEPNTLGISGGKSVWWSWTATTSGTVTVSTAGSKFDTTLGVYSGTSVSGLTVISANDDENLRGNVLTSKVTFFALAGITYQIRVDGYRGASGAITLGLTQTSTVAGLQAPAGSGGALSTTMLGWLQWLQDQGNQNLASGGSTRNVSATALRAVDAFFAALGRRR